MTNPELRTQLRAAAWNQSQITDAARLVVFAVKKNLSVADIDRFIARIAEVQGQTVESLSGYKNMMTGSVSRPAEQVEAWSTKQVYIALGIFLASAAMLGVDACPMEGFDPAKFNEILDLDRYGCSAVVLATAGYRAADDKYAELPKVRFKAEDVIVPIA